MREVRVSGHCSIYGFACLMRPQDSGTGGTTYGRAASTRSRGLLAGLHRLLRYGWSLACDERAGWAILWWKEDRAYRAVPVCESG